MDKFERDVRTNIADKTLCEAVLVGYHAFVEAYNMNAKQQQLYNQAMAKKTAQRSAQVRNSQDSLVQAAMNKKAQAPKAQQAPQQQAQQAPHQQARSAAPASNPGYRADNSKSVNFQSGWEQAQAMYGNRKQPQQQSQQQQSQQQQQPVQTAQKSQQAPQNQQNQQSAQARQVAANRKRVANAGKRSAQQSRSNGMKTAMQNVSDAGARNPDRPMESGNREVAQLAREKFGELTEKFRQKYGTEPSAEQKQRLKDIALKKASVAYRAQGNGSNASGLRVARGADGKPIGGTLAHGQSRTVQNHRARLSNAFSNADKLMNRKPNMANPA